MARSKISAREYKLLLHADRFPRDEAAIADAAAAFWRSLRRASEGVVLEVDDGLAVGERRLIRFYDTADLGLHRNDYICRERIDAASGRREVTLKFRHPDRYFAASRDLSSGGGETKFEEDIKIPFQGLYSHSTTLAIGRDKRFDRLNDPGRLFPGLPGQLDRYDGSRPIAPVGELTVRELVLTGAGFRIGKSPKIDAKCALIVWYDAAGDGDRPELVEFSFRYRADHEAYGGGAARRAYRMFQILQQPALAGWVDLQGTNKTAWVYRHASAALEVLRPPRSRRGRPASRREQELRI